PVPAEHLPGACAGVASQDCNVVPLAMKMPCQNGADLAAASGNDNAKRHSSAPYIIVRRAADQRPRRHVCLDRRVIMKTKLLAVLLLAGGSLFARVHLSVGVGIGPGYGYYLPPPPPPPVVTYVRPVAPGPRYTWINGYYTPVRRRYVWH